jgi:flagellar biosynthesis anti-sigma factor FlgM
MRIDLRTEPSGANAVERTEKASSLRASEKKTAISSGDSSSVNLSGLEAKTTAAPEVRADRVEQLRQALESGTYLVSDEALADAMLNDSLLK